MASYRPRNELRRFIERGRFLDVARTARYRARMIFFVSCVRRVTARERCFYLSEYGWLLPVNYLFLLARTADYRPFEVYAESIIEVRGGFV